MSYLVLYLFFLVPDSLVFITLLIRALLATSNTKASEQQKHLYKVAMSPVVGV